MMMVVMIIKDLEVLKYPLILVALLLRISFLLTVMWVVLLLWLDLRVHCIHILPQLFTFV